MVKYAPTQQIRCKDIQSLLQVSEATAKRYMRDIKQQYGIAVITYNHYAKYFSL